MKTLKLAPGLALPLDAAGLAIALLAKRGAGKTNTGRVLAEELVAAAIHTVVLDPVGAWWGLRSSADGKSAGLAMPILGGQHGDVPLQPTAGALIADVVVDTGQSMILDTSDFSKTEQRRFVVDFAERLYQRKAKNPTLLHLILEEADEFAPQGARSAGSAAETARMRGAVEQLVRRGRGRGIGITMITQRSAVLNKDVLTQTDILLAMRTTGPQDIRAIQDWISGHHVDDDQVIASLPTMQTGEAWAWWPEEGILKRVKIRLAHTFDSSATPRAGAARTEPTRTAPIDLAVLGQQIEATVERVRENDPTVLRARLRELERKAATLETPRVRDEQAEARAAALEERVADLERELRERHDLDEEKIERIVKAARDLREHSTTIAEAADVITGEIAGHVAMAARVRHATPAPPPAPRPAKPRPSPEQASPVALLAPPSTLTKPQQKVVDAIAWWNTVGVDTPLRNQVAFVAGYSHAQSRGFRDPLYSLNASGLVEYPDAGRVSLTADGAALAKRPADMPTEAELQTMICQLVGAKRAKMLQELIGRHPNAVSRDELAVELGYSHAQSRGFRDPLYKLHALELVVYPSTGLVKASDLCFLS